MNSFANILSKGGRHSTVVAFKLHNPAALGLNLSVSKIFSERFLSLSLLDVAELMDSKDSAIKSLIVDRTHPVLVRAILEKT